MVDRIKLVAGDTRPSVYVALYDMKSLAPLDLRTVDVSMSFRLDGAAEILATLPGMKLAGSVDLTTGDVSDTGFDPGAGGRVVFDWPPGALDVDPGYYNGEIELNFSDGTLETVYDLVKFKVRAHGG